MYSKAPKRIRKGWHDWFAWYPVGLVGEKGFAWLETVERKYYQPNRSHVVKAGLNENRFVNHTSVKVMYRRPGVDEEKTIYYTRSGSAYVDAEELWDKRLSDRQEKYLK